MLFRVPTAQGYCPPWKAMFQKKKLAPGELFEPPAIATVTIP